MSIYDSNSTASIFAREAKFKSLYVGDKKILVNDDGSIVPYDGNIMASSITFNNNSATKLSENDVLLLKERALKPVPDKITVETLGFKGDYKTYDKDSFVKLDQISPHLIEQQYDLIKLNDNINIGVPGEDITFKKSIKIGNNRLDNETFSKLANARHKDDNQFGSLNVGGVEITGNSITKTNDFVSKIKTHTANDFSFRDGVTYTMSSADGQTTKRFGVDNIKDLEVFKDHIITVDGDSSKIRAFVVRSFDGVNAAHLNHDNIYKLNTLNGYYDFVDSGKLAIKPLSIYNSDKSSKVDLTYDKIVNYDSKLGAAGKRLIEVGPEWFVDANRKDLTYNNCVFRLREGLDFSNPHVKTSLTFNSCVFVACDFIVCNKYSFEFDNCELIGCGLSLESRSGFDVQNKMSESGTTIYGCYFSLNKSKLVGCKTKSADGITEHLQLMTMSLKDCELSTCNFKIQRMEIWFDVRMTNTQLRCGDGDSIICEGLNGEISNCYIASTIICKNSGMWGDRILKLSNCHLAGWNRFNTVGDTTYGYSVSHHAPIYIAEERYTVEVDSCVFAPAFDPNVSMNEPTGPLAASTNNHLFSFISAKAGHVSQAYTVMSIKNCLLDLRRITGSGRSRIQNIATPSALYNQPGMWHFSYMINNFREIIGYKVWGKITDLGSSVGQKMIFTDMFYNNDFLL